MVLLLVVPLAELSPGRLRNAELRVARAARRRRRRSPSACCSPPSPAAAPASLSAGDLLAHGTVVWLSNIITFGLLFWELDEGGPRLRAERGRRDPDFQFPQDTTGRRPAGTRG